MWGYKFFKKNLFINNPACLLRLIYICSANVIDISARQMFGLTTLIINFFYFLQKLYS